MPFFSASGDVSSILMAGGLQYTENLIRMGLDTQRIMQLLRQRFTPIGGQPYASQVYQAIYGRAQAAIASGAQLNRKRSNVPLTYDQHTGSVGLINNYQYTVFVGIGDDDSGRSRMLPFLISSSTALGKYDVLALANQQALAFINSSQDTLGAGSMGAQYLTGQLRIGDALVRI